jgi:hypothetical protein
MKHKIKTHQGSCHIEEHKFAMGKKKVKRSTTKNLIKKPTQKKKKTKKKLS